MAKFIIISDPNFSAGGNCDFRVHRAGCRDIARHTRLPRFRMAGNTWEREAETAADAIEADVKAFEADQQDYTAEHYHICNCAK